MFHIPINLRIADCVEAPAAWAVLSIVAMQLYKDKIQRGLYNIGLKVYLFRKKKMSLNFQILECQIMQIFQTTSSCNKPTHREEKSVQTEYY